MRLGLLGVVLDGVIQMLQLLVPYPPQRMYELVQLRPHLVPFLLPLRHHLEQGAYLCVVVPANLRLDGLGAGHGGLATHDSRGPTQAGGHDGPERVEGRGADAVLVQEGVEGVEVGGFLIVHVGHEGAEMRVAADEGGSLGCVDEGGGELAGLVHAELFM